MLMLAAPASTLLAAPASTLLAAPTPTPSGDVRYPDPALVTPGTIGFVTVFLLAIGTVFLIRDALRRVRRVRAVDRAENVYPIPMAKEQQRRYQPETRESRANDSFVDASGEPRGGGADDAAGSSAGADGAADGAAGPEAPGPQQPRR